MPPRPRNQHELNDCVVFVPGVGRYTVIVDDDSLTFKHFKQHMEDAAFYWGDKGVGRMVMKGAKPLRMKDGSVILALGQFNGCKYVTWMPDVDKYEFTVTEYNFPKKYNNFVMLKGDE